MKRLKPYIVINYSNVNEQVLKEIKAGIEEEGCLYFTIKSEVNKDSLSLSYEASRQSSLGIGIGVNGTNAKVSVRQQLEPVYIETKDNQPRTIGQNAARFIKGKPLR